MNEEFNVTLTYINSKFYNRVKLIKEKGNMEEVEAVRRPLIVKEKLDRNGGQYSGQALSSSTPITTVGLSIFLFYCGSYAAGN